MATITDPALQVFDNQSVVMSDFYVESSEQIAVFSGTPDENAGTVTIQGPKAEMSTTNIPVFDIQGYAGRIYYGQVLFYCQPAQTIFQASATTSLSAHLDGRCLVQQQSGVRFGAGGDANLAGQQRSR